MLVRSRERISSTTITQRQEPELQIISHLARPPLSHGPIRVHTRPEPCSCRKALLRLFSMRSYMKRVSAISPENRPVSSVDSSARKSRADDGSASAADPQSVSQLEAEVA